MILYMQSWNKPLLILMVLVLVSANIYAKSEACWEFIECDKVSLPSGVIMNYEPEIEIVCGIYGLNLNLSNAGKIEIEILQPGYNGATLKQNLLINEDFINNVGGNPIFFYLGRGMSPTYVNCYDVVTTINGELTRISSMKHWSSSFNNTWFATINPHPNANTWESNNYLSNVLGTVFDVNAVTTATIKDTNIIKTYENLKSDETNWFFYGVSLFMFIIGLLLIFTTVIAYTKRR